MSYHLFGPTSGATEAMSYFSAGRAVMTGLSPVPIARYGDQVLAIGGRADGGNEVTIYLRIGAFLIRISAVAPFGDPGADAITTAQGVQALMTGSDASPKSVEDLLPGLSDFPLGWFVSNEGNRSLSEIANTFLRPNEAASVLSASGFQGNVYRYFTAASNFGPYPGAAVTIEVSLHLFENRDGAVNALPYYADGRAESLGLRVVGQFEIGDGAYVLRGPSPTGSGIEVTAYMLVGNVLARVSAMSLDGDPTADALATAWIVASRR